MEYPAVVTPDTEDEDPDIAAIIDALAHTLEIREALRPVMLRLEERRRCHPPPAPAPRTQSKRHPRSERECRLVHRA